MANKCSNCGFEYGEYDIYCSRCGQKINNALDISSTAQQVYEKFITENDVEVNKTQKELEFFHKLSSYKGNIFDAFAIMFLISLVLTVFVVLLFYKQSNTRAYLEFKNLISKPSQIPLLKNPETIEDFSITLKRNERFLKLYLKYSKDDSEKKELIFYNYLTELSKLSNITNNTLVSEKKPECEIIKSKDILNKCNAYFKKELRGTGAKPFVYNNTIFLYPDRKFIYNEYSKFLSQDMKKLLKLENKYSKPTSYDGIVYEKPNYITKKISAYEDIYNNQTNPRIKEIVEQSLYYDVKNVLFSRNIFDTTTQEMQSVFKLAFEKYILKNKYSPLNSLFMNYLDKQKNYTQDNFAKDYPYKIFDDTFDENVQSSTFKDIFAQLRKNLALNSQSVDFAYIYNLADGGWTRYKPGVELNSHNYVISYPDEDNNVTFYDFAYSPVQEMNIQENTTLFINSGQIYTYNYDKLSFSKITFNGKLFNTKSLNFTDITTIFPGVNIINIDSTNGYEIYVEKVNKNANFVLLSRYAQGMKDYELTAIKGEIKNMTLSNMFSVNTNDEVIISFHNKNQLENENSEQYPNYKIHITTVGQSKPTQSLINNEGSQEESDDNESDDNEIEPHTPTIKPKITTDENDALVLPPSKNLEPLSDDE